MQKNITPIAWKDVQIQDGFWKDRQKLNHEKTIASIYRNSIETGRIDLLKLDWSEDKKTSPHHFWDSDNGKMIEAVAYSLVSHPDPTLEQKMDEIIDLMENAQQDDGYMNSYFTLFCPERRFTDLMMMHELYCAGHLTEGAVAYYQATGKRKFLDIMCRYIDYIDSVFGKAPEKLHGYDGHPEIELALVKLYKATGNKKYYLLAKYFVDERGIEPYFFEEEARIQGLDVNRESIETDDIGSFLVNRLKGAKAQKTAVDPMIIPKRNQPRVYKNYLKSRGPFAQFQAHKPVRDIDTPVGHAVRAMYMYCAMADLAKEDPTLAAACKNIWKSLVTTQLYITGGIGQSQECERFSYAYDLPNEGNYNETCASIGLAMWAHRMLHLEPDAKYADILERTLYNGILSGVSYTGDRFFYANYLAMYPEHFKHASSVIAKSDKISPERLKWFTVSCCPANLARIVASVGGYMYSTSTDGLYVHLFSQSTTQFSIGGKAIRISQSGNYPWDGNIGFDVQCEGGVEFSLSVRVPGWCRDFSLQINGKPVEAIVQNGYLYVRRTWYDGDKISYSMEMPVLKLRAHPKVRQDSGRVALQRGPVVYCLEEIDNFTDLNDFVLHQNGQIQINNSSLFGGIVTLEMTGTKTHDDAWNDELYRECHSPRVEAKATAIPYFLWANRGLGEMLVWIRSDGL